MNERFKIKQLGIFLGNFNFFSQVMRFISIQNKEYHVIMSNVQIKYTHF